MGRLGSRGEWQVKVSIHILRILVPKAPYRSHLRDVLLANNDIDGWHVRLCRELCVTWPNDGGTHSSFVMWLKKVHGYGAVRSIMMDVTSLLVSQTQHASSDIHGMASWMTKIHRLQTCAEDSLKKIDGNDKKDTKLLTCAGFNSSSPSVFVPSSRECRCLYVSSSAMKTNLCTSCRGRIYQHRKTRLQPIRRR